VPGSAGIEEDVVVGFEQGLRGRRGGVHQRFGEAGDGEELVGREKVFHARDEVFEAAFF
jgi:hypothetical protein